MRYIYWGHSIERENLFVVSSLFSAPTRCNKRDFDRIANVLNCLGILESIVNSLSFELKQSLVLPQRWITDILTRMTATRTYLWMSKWGITEVVATIISQWRPLPSYPQQRLVLLLPPELPLLLPKMKHCMNKW